MCPSTHAAHRIVEWLDGTELDAARVGGKGASLNRLARAGFRIPPGFCLTTDAFVVQVGALDAAAPIRHDAAVLAVDEIRRTVVEVLRSAPPTDPIAAALLSSLERLAGEPVGGRDGPPQLAVRSSAVAEDSAGSSFAGLHDTELELTADEVPAAVARCWASLWSDRAVAYRQRRGLALDGGAMAVVIQALVPARSAAVAFTRHPVTGRSDQVLVNAVRGLGEAMVSGTVTPDTIVVDKANGAVVEFTAGDVPDGPALDDDVLAELVGLCRSVEVAFGAPVDVEAAYADDGWYLLQARPITTG